MPINFGLARNVGETIFVLVLYIILGFFMRKRGVIDDRVNTGLTKLFMLTSLPATILNAMFNQPYDSDRLRDILIVFFGIIVIYLIFAFVGLGLGKLFKLPRNRYGTYAMTLSFGNVGIMGFPVVGALWGGPGAFYASIVSVAYFVMLPTIGTWLTVKSAADENGEPVKYRLKMNLGLAASIVGLLFYFTQNFLPVWLIQFIRPAVVDGVGGGPLGRFIGGVAATMTPISMFLIGGLLAKGKVSEMFKERESLVLSAVKLLIAPIALFFVARLIITDPTALGVLIILSAMPAASLAAVFAEKFGADSAFSSRAVFLSTAASLVTVPLVALLL